MMSNPAKMERAADSPEGHRDLFRAALLENDAFCRETFTHSKRQEAMALLDSLASLQRDYPKTMATPAAVAVVAPHVGDG